MKKYLLLFFIILCCSCGKKTIGFDTQQITNINFDGIEIIEEDYSKITESLALFHFKESTQENYNHATPLMTITTKEYLYQWRYQGNTLYYQYDNHIYQTNQEEDLKTLLSVLSTLKEIYLNSSFYTIELLEEFQPQTEDLTIRIDQSNRYLVIHPTQDLYHFQIHRIEQREDIKNDVDLLYEKDQIGSSQMISIRIDDPTTIRISFETKYRYVASITPIYDDVQDQIIFQSDFKSK